MENLEERAKQIEEELNDTQLPSTEVNKGGSLTVGESTLQDLQNKFLQKQIEGGKTLTEISTDFAKASVTNEIINSDTEENREFRKGLAKRQKKALEEGFTQDVEKGKTRTIEEKKKKAEAFYSAFRPILEYDFSNLIKKDDEKERRASKTYEDRSYGIWMMIGMLLFLTVPYFIISFILALFNGINAILEEINTFGKIAKYVVLSIVIIFFSVLIVYCTILSIDHVFGTSILRLA